MNDALSVRGNQLVRVSENGWKELLLWGHVPSFLMVLLEIFGGCKYKEFCLIPKPKVATLEESWGEELLKYSPQSDAERTVSIDFPFACQSLRTLYPHDPLSGVVHGHPFSTHLPGFESTPCTTFIYINLYLLYGVLVGEASSFDLTRTNVASAGWLACFRR